MMLRVVSLILFNNEDLSIDDQFIQTYVDGNNCPIKVSLHTNLDDLKHKFLRSLYIDLKDCTINLTCWFTMEYGQQFYSINIFYDEVCDVSHTPPICNDHGALR